ncbi:MAG: hypothetical protein KAS67_03200 [Thermoplasmata archaeon]|nr:hypothetical protein [Thermoplasmata archaeon]
MAEEELFGSSDAEAEAEIRRIEAEIDAESGPGIIDLDRIGKAMVILGTIFFVTYIGLLIISTMVQAEESWGIFNLWSVSQFLMITVGSILMIGIGYFLTVRYGELESGQSI